jgi:uncharacterized protein GlcG (DUF336 family)
MPMLQETIALEDAEQLIRMAGDLAAAASIAGVDAGGHLVALKRQDSAVIGTAELAIDNALSVRIHDNSTEALSVLAQPGAELHGIQQATADGASSSLEAAFQPGPTADHRRGGVSGGSV